MPGRLPRRNIPMRRFNPRPSLPRGDAPAPSTARAALLVSIRAPRCRGAMLLRDAELGLVALVSIRAPRCRGAMRGCHLSLPSLLVFQSAPLVAEGRCACLHRGSPKVDGFNPRPSLPRGDALSRDIVWLPLIVSIRAPRCRGAMPGVSVCSAQPFWFQSAPLVAEGRCSSPVTSGSTGTKCSHCANLLPMSEIQSYAKRLRAE